MPETSAHQIVELLYRAAGEPEHWPAALGAVAREFDAKVAQLLWWDKRPNRTPDSLIGGTPTPGTEADYLGHYSRIDPRQKLVVGVRVGAIYACHQHFDERFVAHSEIYQDFLIPIGGRYSMIGKLADDDDEASTVGMIRPLDRGPFDDDDRARFHLLLPHIARAAWMHRKLARARAMQDGVRATLDLLDWAVILTDGSGRVVSHNFAAERLLATGAGLRIVQGRLKATEADDDNRLTQLIATAERTARGSGFSAGGSLAVRRAPERKPLLVTVAPLTAGTTSHIGQDRPAAVVFVHDPETSPKTSTQRLIELFGLTPAEARFAVELASGQSLDDIAGLHGVSKNTVRAQARAVFAKTETNRQTELVRLLMGLPPATAPKSETAHYVGLNRSDS